MNTIINFSAPVSPIFRGSNISHSNPIASTAVDSVSLSKPANPYVEALNRALNLVKNGISDEPIDKEMFKNMTYNDWARTYNLSQENGISGFIYDAISKNPDISMPEEVRTAFELTAEHAEKNHEMQEKVLKNLTALTDKFGIDTVQMKGIGFSMNYPNPTHRYGGDIDIFNFKRGENAVETQKEASFKVDKIAKRFGMEVDTTHGLKHSIIFHKGMPIENHRSFLNVEGSKFAQKIEKYLKANVNPREQILPKGTKILVPSHEFNTVFISYHAMQHYINGDANAHHLADWSALIRKNGLKVPEEVKGTPLERFMYAMTNLSNKHLGTNIKVPEDKALEDSLFSQYTNSVKKQKPKSNSVKDIFVFKYNKMVAREKRAKEFLGEGSTIRGLFNSLKAHASIEKMIKVLTQV